MPIERYQVSLKVFLKNDEGKFLFLKNANGIGKHSDRYDLPGGRMEAGEVDIPIFEALKREIYEELGTDIKYEIEPRPIGLAQSTVIEDSGPIPVLYVMFMGNFLGGEIRISDEHKSFVWDPMDGVDLHDYAKTGNFDALEAFLVKRRSISS